MPRGGKRDGCGRKSGEAWASKKPAAVRALARDEVRRLLAAGKDPVQALCTIAWDDKVDIGVRVQAAAAAAPFCHPRLSMALVTDATQRADRIDTAQLLTTLNERFNRIAAASGRTIEGRVATAEKDAA